MDGPSCLLVAAAYPQRQHRGRDLNYFLHKFILFIHCTCSGSNTPGYWEVRTSRHQLRYHGGCLHPPCTLQQATHDSEHLGCALLGTSKCNAYVLPAALVPRLFPKSWAVSLAAVS